MSEEPSSLLDWVTGLATDPVQRARLAAEPHAVLAERGLDEVPPPDLHHALPLVADSVSARLGTDVDASAVAATTPQIDGEHPLDALARHLGAATDTALGLDEPADDDPAATDEPGSDESADPGLDDPGLDDDLLDGLLPDPVDDHDHDHDLDDHDLDDDPAAAGTPAPHEHHEETIVTVPVGVSDRDLDGFGPSPAPSEGPEDDHHGDDRSLGGAVAGHDTDDPPGEHDADPTDDGHDPDDGYDADHPPDPVPETVDPDPVDHPDPGDDAGAESFT